jgi:hypothetical protein
MHHVATYIAEQSDAGSVVMLAAMAVGVLISLYLIKKGYM